MVDSTQRKEKTKWFFMGLLFSLLCIVLVAAACLFWSNRGLTHDPFGHVTPDMGEPVNRSGKPATGQSTVMALGDTGFIAVAGPSRYRDNVSANWDYYTISVQRRDGASSFVFFERQFTMGDIPSDLLNKRVGEITSFDSSSGEVSFRLGTSVYKYTLPTCCR